MDAKELPARPNLEQYKKQAKELIKISTSGDPDGLARIKRQHVRLAKLSDAEFRGASIRLADAQLVIAREHGFESWPKFAQHIEALTRQNSSVSKFEAAADAIVAGDLATLERLLREDPELVRARSSRAHRATLLHYVAANGVEDFRQKTPKNAVAVAGLVLKAGAEVDATTEVYGAKSTTLGLVASSIHPLRAGVQIALLETLLEHGAAIAGVPGGSSPLIAALQNGRAEAAEFLAQRGARLDLEGAAGVGRLDVVQSFFNQDGSLTADATKAQMESGFLWACEYGRTGVVDFLLTKGADLGAQGNTGLTALHWAVVGGQLEAIKLLLEHKAPLEATNVYGATVLGQALWSATNGDRRIDYVAIIETLLAAGAKVDAVEYLTGNERLDEVLQRYGAKLPGTAARQQTPRTTSEVAENLMQRALQARREKRLSDAQRDLKDAVELSREQGTRSELARALRELGELERHLPDGDAALRHYEEAVAILRELDQPTRLAHTIRHLGDVHHDAGRAALAEPCYQEALTLYRRSEVTRPVELANAVRSLAVLKGEAAQIEEATVLWREAHDLYGVVNIPAGVAESAARLALLAWRQGDRPRSREWLSSASAAADASEDPKSARYVGQVRAMIES
jgi:tetratricopeptide (TPR) repeat protein